MYVLASAARSWTVHNNVDGPGEGLRKQVRRCVTVGAVSLSVFLLVSVGEESESATDLHVAVITE